MKTLELLGNEIQRIYDINLDSVKNIFLGIIEDEERHRELLSTIKVLFKQKEQEMLVEDPLVRYRGLLHQKY
jgi:rubrerythrin